MKKVAILGAGLVAGPIVKRLLNKGFYVTVADIDINKAKSLAGSHPNGNAVAFSVENDEQLDNIVKENDLVVSILPWTFHLLVAKKCILHKKNMVTSSYAKPEMRALDQDAKDAGIIILNETGLDPGIDHMSAKRIIDNIHKKGGRIDAFFSICGALPAPEAADNPFKYKFSWSPKGVVMASNNDAKFLYNGEVMYLETDKLFSNPVNAVFPGVGDLQIYPNRDSLSYVELYGIPETKTMYRGTFRYHGWCEILDAFKKLKLISYDKVDFTGMTYPEMLAKLIGKSNVNNIRNEIAAYLNISVNSLAVEALEWLGMFRNVGMGRGCESPFEITSDLMIAAMGMTPHERDMVAMLHVFVATNVDGGKEVIHSRLLEYGTPATFTAIARTVAIPAAIAAEMILTDKINLKGVHIPVLPEIYNPILDELEVAGIKFEEEYGLPLSATLF